MSDWKMLSVASSLSVAIWAASAAGATPSLREAAGGHPLIGAAVMSSQLEQPALARLIAQQFDCLTPENELKPEETEPQPGVFNFTAGDKILAFTQSHGMKLIGHNLCWHEQTPAWMFKDEAGNPLPRDKALANLKRHIDGVAGHYKGKVLGWDVVNEALSDTPGEYLRNSPARKAIGDDFIEQAFKFAKAADPSAELYYNDYSDENPDKREKTIRLIRYLKAKGCRIDAVGIQGHFMIKYPGTPSVVEDAIQAFSAEGVKVCITELDLDMLPRKNDGANITDIEKSNGIDPYPKTLPSELMSKQVDFYKRLFAVIERHRDVVERVTFWGTHDGTSWLNTYPVAGRTNHPLLWDRQLKPKPAFYAVLAAMRGR